MKKIILALTVVAFSFITTHAAEASCIDVGAAIADGTSTSEILDSLTASSCGMSFQDAEKAVDDAITITDDEQDLADGVLSTNDDESHSASPS